MDSTPALYSRGLDLETSYTDRGNIPNAAIKWTVLLLCIQEVLIQRPVILTEVSHGLPQSLQDSTSKYATTASFHILSNSLCPNYSLIQSYVVRGIDSVVEISHK
jgi:hypothetical protein